MPMPSTPRALLLLLALAFNFTSCCMADPRTNVVLQNCSTTLAVSGAVLADNFVPAMANLSQLVSQNGFGTTVVGHSPNSVYGLAQCLGDLNSIDCMLCFSEIRSQLPKCYPNIGGRIFLDGCFGRYANYSFFNDALDANDTTLCVSTNNTSNPATFTQVVTKVIGNVTAQALQNHGYAIGSASHSNTTVYALAQCWQNLNTQLCGSCLAAAGASLVSCAPATQGRSLYAGCYIRYSTELFWNVYQASSNSSGKHGILWIILGSLLGSFLLIVGIVVLRKRGFWRKPNKSLEALYGPQLSAVISQSNLNFKYEELKKATSSFNLSLKLGQGSYGTVYKAVLSDGKEVAVKRLFLNTREWVDQFLNEVNLVNRIRHKNLVKLLGCSVDGPESLLVYEYYHNKSLDHFIFDLQHDKHLNWQQRFDIIQGVAEGLSYLHEESETRIIHRDIKASNILLDEKFKAKITDFGLARSFIEGQTHLTTGVAGTLGYMAPEYIVHGHLTEKADVYSFGTLVLEIVTGKRCSSTVGSHEGFFLVGKIWNHYKANMIDKIVDESIYNGTMKDEILHVVKVGLLCTQANPHDRPTMAKVVELLRSSRNEGELIIAEPPFLDVCAMESMEKGEGSSLLSTSYAPGLPTSTDSQFSGR